MKKVKTKKRVRIMPDVWQSIDEMPIFNWFRIHQTNDLKFMFKKERKGYDKKTKLYLLAALANVRDEYIDTFGISPELREILILQAEIQSMKIKSHLTQDRTFITFINIKQHQLDNIKKETQQSEDPYLTKARVEKYMRFRLNEKETTVKEYYNYIALIKQDVAARKPANHGD